jgi:hypothetical protein
MSALLSWKRVWRNDAGGRVSITAMRDVVLGVALLSLAACSSDDASRRRPPDTAIDNSPPALTNQRHLVIAFHANGTANRFICHLDGTTGSCLSPFETDVADGEHTFQVAAALNTAIDDTPATVTWRVDTVPPDTTIVTAPPSLDNSLAPEFTFQGTDDRGAVTFECALDDGAFTACSSPATVAVTDGDHRYQVRAVDAAGNPDPTPATTSWTVDTTAPDTMITAGPAAGSTTATDVTFAFGSPDGAAGFECSLDGAPFASCTSPRSFTLGDGPHSFAARARDTLGQVDPSPAMRGWTVDATPPAVAITQAPGDPSNSATGTFAFSSGDPTASFACQIDGAGFAPCSSGFTSASLADGSHTFTVRATDPVGNAATAAFTWTIDTVAPAVTITGGPPAATASTTATFTFTTSGGAVAVACSVDGGAFATCTSPQTVSGNADGMHSFVVRATDAAGNQGSDTRAWTVDTVPPVVSVTPVTTPTNNTAPSVSFTVTGATAIQCRVDAGSFAACTSPFTPPALPDGGHTVTVRGTDAVGNVGTGATTFTVDATPPPLAFDDTPPAQWPVNYFDMKFHTTDASATLACSLNGAAFTACASPFTVTTSYNVSSTFAVRATDPVGNAATISTSWTSSNGLVLHYPWEQGQAHNTSLLAQNAAYSPDSPVTLPVTGGWAGTAAASPPAHTYAGTIRPLSSSANGSYTASIWIRVGATGSGSGTILSTLTASNGIMLTISGRQVSLRVNENNTAFTANAVIPLGRWLQLGLLTSGPGTGVQLLVNGAVAGTAMPPTVTGFGPGQAANLTVGNLTGVDIDDLRFYNRALSTSEICSTLLRGQPNAQGACAALIPGFELDFENEVRNSGRWNLTLTPPGQFSFVPTRLGTGLKLATVDQSFGFTGFASQVSQDPGHSFSFWFVAGAAPSDTLIDFFHSCAAGAPGSCGIRVTHSTANGLTVLAGNGGQTAFSRTIAVPNGTHSVVVTEQKAADGVTTQSLSIYIDGNVTVLPIGAGNVYSAPSDTVILPRAAGTTIDEFEFWPRDLSLDAEMLCENGWDGEWNPATGVCLLTSN